MDKQALEANLDQTLTTAVERQQIVGGVVVVLHDGAPIYRRAVGLADRESGTPMQVDTVFRLASITKPIVSIAALRLADEGKLELDAPVTRYLPDFRPKLGEREPKLTVKQLLTHTAGLSYGFIQPPDGPYPKLGVSDGLAEPGLPFDEELRRIAKAGLFYEPGTKWVYSLAIDVLGAVLERAADQPLPAAIEALVTKPLDLTRTTFSAPTDQPLATPYTEGTPPVRMGDPHVVPWFGTLQMRFSPSRTYDPKSFPSGGAGMNGVADDVARVLEAVRSGGESLLKPETARAMMTNHTGTLPIDIGPGWGFGYGGAVLVDPSVANTPQNAGTWSWGGVWGHKWFVDPAQRLVVVGLTNTAFEGMMGRFPIMVRDAIYAALPK